LAGGNAYLLEELKYLFALLSHSPFGSECQLVPLVTVATRLAKRLGITTKQQRGLFKNAFWI
jgi:hypothetical protein